MNKYELTYLIPDSFSEEEATKEREKIKKLLKEAKVSDERILGRRKLAYPIGKKEYAYYITLLFEIGPEEIKKINSEIKMQENILRHLIVAKPMKEEKPVTEIKAVKEEKKVEAQKPTPKKEKPTKKIEVKEKGVKEKMKALDKKLEEILKE